MLFSRNSLKKSKETLEDIKPLKGWFILREDIDFNSDRLFNIGIQATSQHFYEDIDNNNTYIKNKWIDQGSKIETRMMFNMDLIHKLEDKLIVIGAYFRWVYSNKTLVGIFIEPSLHNYNEDLLSDCMTLENFAKFRQEKFNELNSRKVY